MDGRSGGGSCLNGLRVGNGAIDIIAAASQGCRAYYACCGNAGCFYALLTQTLIIAALLDHIELSALVLHHFIYLISAVLFVFIRRACSVIFLNRRAAVFAFFGIIRNFSSAFFTKHKVNLLNNIYLYMIIISV